MRQLANKRNWRIEKEVEKCKNQWISVPSVKGVWGGGWGWGVMEVVFYIFWKTSWKHKVRGQRENKSAFKSVLTVYWLRVSTEVCCAILGKKKKTRFHLMMCSGRFLFCFVFLETVWAIVFTIAKWFKCFCKAFFKKNTICSTVWPSKTGVIDLNS